MTVKESLLKTISAGLEGRSEKFLLGICGPPGAGKSTLAEWLLNEWNHLHPGEAVLVPMDGYHFSNAELEAKGLLQLKGIPETFDSRSFLQKVVEIKNLNQERHFCPRFDRSIEASIQAAICVLPEHRLVIVEGNYLLLETEPWQKIRDLLDDVWFVEASEDLLLDRLLARHMAGGMDELAAGKKVDSTDLPNAKLVSASKIRANRVVNSADLKFN